MSPFAKFNGFLSTWSGDLLTLATTLFGIGFMFCGFMVWKGDEDNVPRFKKALFWTGLAFGVCLLGPLIVTWIRAGLA